MASAAVLQLKPPVNRHVFTEQNTMADLFALVNELEKAGKPPFLKFLGARGQISAAEILFYDPESSHGEMAVVGADEASLEDAGKKTCSFCGRPLDLDGECGDPACPNSVYEDAELDAEDNGEVLLPDPAERARAMDHDVRWAAVQPETPVYWEGEWTTWAALSGNERMECVFNGDGVIVGGYSI